MYRLRAEDAKVLPEFLRKERRDFSLELRRILNRLRLTPIAGREVLVAAEPKGWRIAKLGQRRGDPVRFVDDRVFAEHKRAEWEILKHRWQQLMGTALQDPELPA